jgi:hypothetical protein
VAGADPHAVAVEAQPQRDLVPGRRQAGVHAERPAGGSQPEEPVGERLPRPAEGGQVQAAGGGPGAVVQVQPAGEPEQLQGLVGLAGAGQQRGVDRR